MIKHNQFPMQEDLRHLPRGLEEETQQSVAFLCLPLIFMIQKLVITESVGIGSLLRMDEMGEGELILKIIVIPETGTLWGLLGHSILAEKPKILHESPPFVLT